MVVGGSTIGNNDDDGPGVGDNLREGGGRQRIGKDADVEDVDVESDGEELALP